MDSDKLRTSALIFGAVGLSYTIHQTLTKPKAAKTKYLPKLCKELPDAKGKVFVITGTTSGTGLVAARVAAEKGGEVVLLNRASKRVDTMMETLKQQVPNGKFVPIECDLQDFSSVRKAIKEIKSRYTKIYALCNNAGIMATPDKATVDGYDTQMQTNHLSHFLLTAELYPLLEKQAEETGDARIVNHSSGGRHATTQSKPGLEEKYFGPNGGNLGGNECGMMSGACFERYFQTKLANSVFTRALDAKLRAKHSKVRACCAHPGGSDTNLADNVDFTGVSAKLVMAIFPLLAQTPEDGALGILTGMMHPNAESGALYGPRDVGFMAIGISGWAVSIPPKPYETDPRAIAMLWETSEKATGVTFTV